MSDNLRKSDAHETVRVLSDYSYKPDGSTEIISLKVGDEFRLIKKVNSDWWYVQKSRSLPLFYIPAKYVEVVVPKGSTDMESGGKSRLIDGGGGKSPLIGGGGGKSPNLTTSFKSLAPTSPAVISPTVKVAPKPLPRHITAALKSASEDEALNVLDAAIDKGEVGETTNEEAVRSTTKLKSVSESPLEKKVAEPPQDKDKAKTVGVESTKKPLAHPPLPTLTIATAPSVLPASPGLHTPPGSSSLSTSPAPSVFSCAPATVTSEVSPPEYMNLEEYNQKVLDRIAQMTVAGDNPINRDTVDMTTVAGDNPAESETSDYRSGDSKGGSRESLDSDSQEKSCDTDSTGTKEELEKVEQGVTPLPVPNLEDSAGKAKASEPALQPRPAVNKSQSGKDGNTSQYANLEAIRAQANHQNRMSTVTTNGKTPVGGPPAVEVPSGWRVEVDGGVSTYVNTATGDKWTIVVDNDRHYFYNRSTHATVWSLADVPKLASSSVSHRVSSSKKKSTDASAKSKDRRTLPTSTELNKKESAWHLLRLAISGKSGKMLEGSIAEAEPNSSEAAAEFPALEPLPIKMAQKQGPLGKAKADLGKKSKKPSWSQSYAVLWENGLYFYKDQKASAAAKPRVVSSLGKPELILDLTDAQLSSSPDEKKNQILVLTLSKGDVYLLHNESEDVLQHWRESLENNIAVLVTTPVKDAKDLSIMTPTKIVEMTRMSSYVGVLAEDRLHIADKLLHWLKLRPTKEALQAKGILKDAVFGSSLTELCERERTKIPRFVHECIVAVEKRGLDVEGVYRVAGNLANVQKLRQMADNNEFYDLNSSFWDIHAVTGALKLFFRELSEPLFTFALFDEFLDAYKAQGKTRQVKAIRDIVRKLPSIHRDIMKELFRHLTDVIRHTASNRMNTQALAIVFGPTLLWPEAKNKDVTLAANLVYQGQVVEFMIIEFKAIFL